MKIIEKVKNFEKNEKIILAIFLIFIFIIGFFIWRIYTKYEFAESIKDAFNLFRTLENNTNN